MCDILYVTAMFLLQVADEEVEQEDAADVAKEKAAAAGSLGTYAFQADVSTTNTFHCIVRKHVLT